MKELKEEYESIRDLALDLQIKISKFTYSTGNDHRGLKMIMTELLDLLPELLLEVCE